MPRRDFSLRTLLLLTSTLGLSCTATLDGADMGAGDREDNGTTTSAFEACNELPVQPPESLELDPFYEKFVDAGGIPIVATSAVSDDAFVIACEIVSHMLSKRPDVAAALAANDVRVGIIAVDDGTTDMPEHRNLDSDFPLPDGETWNERTRGVGATHAVPMASVGEENLLGLSTDRYLGQSILVHEFAHTIFDLGVADVDPITVQELATAFEGALEDGLYGTSYAATNTQEYWAEGVQSWYGTNPNQDGNPVETRNDMMMLDADLALLVSEVLPDDGFILRTARDDAAELRSGRDPRHPRDDR